jgi:hypothetical protein
MAACASCLIWLSSRGRAARKKAIVDKSRLGVGALRSPRSVFLVLVRMDFTLELARGF